MCKVNVTCSGSGGQGAGAVLVLAGGLLVAGSLVVSAVSAVVVSLAALVSTLVWAVATVAGVAVLGTALVHVVRAVLEYRADRADAEAVLAQLAARGLSGQPHLAQRPEIRMVAPVEQYRAAGVRRLPLTARGGSTR